jgi:hypothetical protein
MICQFSMLVSNAFNKSYINLISIEIIKAFQKNKTKRFFINYQILYYRFGKLAYNI